MNSAKIKKNLYLELQKGKFCYVAESTALACNTLSKATCHDMAKLGYRSFPVSTQRTHQTWDQQIITCIWQGFHPDNIAWLSQWLSTTAHLTAQQRLIQFADELLLSDLCEGPLLICLNNIDSLSDNPSAIHALLAWVAYCYELRDTYLTYRHLSIVAFGTAMPKAYLFHPQQPVVMMGNTHTAQFQMQNARRQQPTSSRFALC